MIVRLLIDEGYIDFDDLITIGIGEDFVKNLILCETPHSLGGPSIQQSYNCDFNGVELYFVGFHNAGTTSMIGVILSTLANGKHVQGMHINEDSPSYFYAQRLSHWSFCSNQSKVTRFFQSNISYRSQSFDINLEKNNQEKPYRFVKLNSDLPFCLFKKDVEEPEGLLSEYAYNDYLDLIIKRKNKNRRIFFFTIPCEVNDTHYAGLPLNVYLESTIRVMYRDGVFDEFTEAIYILVTKVDKLSKSLDLNTQVKNYVGQRYGGLYNSLNKISKDYEINHGNVPIIYFSCGETCFQDMVKINTSFAESFIDSVLLSKEEQPPPKGIRKLLISLFGK